MWNAPDNPIPESQIRRHHLSVIRAAVEDAEEFDIRGRRDLEEALNYWKPLAPAGVRRFEKGLREGSLPLLGEAAHMIVRLL